jgi:uroporphyrinogen III methyltransferase/synthase
VVASIGPITAETAARHGIISHIVPESYTIPALADALVRHFHAVGRPSGPAQPVRRAPFSIDNSSI